jgi:hypothetical protein
MAWRCCLCVCYMLLARKEGGRVARKLEARPWGTRRDATPAGKPGGGEVCLRRPLGFSEGRKEGWGLLFAFRQVSFPPCAALRRAAASPPLPSLGPGYESTTTPASICLLGALGAGGSPAP